MITVTMVLWQSPLLAEDAKSDIQDVLVHPRTRKVQAASSNFTRTSWKTLDASIQPDLDYLKGVYDGELSVVDRSLDDGRWVVAYEVDDGPTRYYRYIGWYLGRRRRLRTLKPAEN